MIEARELLRGLAERFPPRDTPWQGEGRQAGVLVALTDEAEPRVVLGRRAQHLPLHPGEVAFPGGKREPEDRGVWETAVRESEEEVALPPALVSYQAQLPPLVTRTRYEVHPCIGLIPPGLSFTVDPAEFDSVFTPALSLFARREHFRLERMLYRDEEVYVPHYEIGSDTVWGVTAAVLAQIVNVVYDAGFDLKRDWKALPEV